jgi:hypothetical protein
MNSRREVAKTVKQEYSAENFVRGNYIVTIAYWQDVRGIGVSKRNPNDEYNENLGSQKSLGRALTDLINQVWEQRYHLLYEAGWISPGVPGTIGSNGAGKRLAQWLQDRRDGLATDEDFGKDLTPMLNVHPAIWHRVDEA